MTSTVDDVNSPRLDDQLCFALYAASRAVIAAQRPGLRELGLTYPQYLVMMALWEQRSVPIGGLCERLHLDSGTVSPLVRRLESAGLVRRRRSPEDERSVIVELTDEGAAMSDRSDCVTAALADSVEALTADGHEPSVTADDLGPLKAVLHNLVDELDRLNSVQTQREQSQRQQGESA